MNIAMWLIPTELAQEIATLFIMLSGVAFMLRMTRAAWSLIVLAVILLAMEPLLEPMVEAAIDVGWDEGAALVQQLPWWVTAIVAALFGLLVLKVVLSFFLGRRAADNAVGTLAADGIRTLLSIFLTAPIRIIGGLFRSINR